ncbi:ABC transporter ATP-binding protein [Actinobacteria bacterium YIM 96077]|uniref:ABC transporter ATP-binding protein n=1 Tax=Phytoactinopolyspora halophila TaxID=1981511 RepID=A0A329QCZ1_9ACTN|nr:ABC transporter ATP-binding protein [Phytoactinopolyspora halophila]AYY14148.1 ABC transporter ATP-binding protein [Actinobacteria bacterium YIM 96077]RAW09609.1 ABC transporter ATP-binding protein [Phytoactinopolyspora halophila]
MNAQTSVVHLTGVSRLYPGHPPVRALDGVSLSIEPGEMVGIVGPSGSGKSTMLNILGTLDRADSGVVRIDGHDVAELADRQLSALRAWRIGFVFQQFFLSPGVSALDNVADGLLYTGMSLRKRRSQARTTLEHVELGDRTHHKPHELSGGQRQRVAVARALAGRPSLLLADEPTGALDSTSGAAVIKLLHELHDAGTTIVVITHDHDVAKELPRQIHILDGKIESDERARQP